jgi:hypothetical protein
VSLARSRTSGTHVLDVGMRTRCDSLGGLVVDPQNHPALLMVGFAEFGPQNSAVVVPEGTDCGMWCHNKG